MVQIHPQVRTTPALRADIARSSEPAGVVAKRYGISDETSASGANGENRRFRIVQAAPFIWPGE